MPSSSSLRLLCRLSLAFAAASSSCVQLRPRSPGAVGGRDVSMRFEGSCAHLACCSTHAVPVSVPSAGAFLCDGQASGSCARNVGWFAPGFTCNPLAAGRYRQPEDAPYLGCNDQERWLALPGLESSQCGVPYLVCHRGARVTAVARDRSAANDSGRVHIEGSFGLLRALGADPSQRETIVSVYALDEGDRIAADPHCVGDER
jgi:hypothetical protein